MTTKEIIHTEISESEFNHLITETQSSLFAFIFSLVAHKQDSEDILQKTNLILCKKRDQFNPKLASFKTWSYNIARYQVMAYKTVNSRSKLCFSNELTETLADEIANNDVKQIQANALNICYKKLPDHMKKIAELRYKRDYTVKEISTSLNRPLGAISATLYRIRQNILSCISIAYKEAEREYYKY